MRTREQNLELIRAYGADYFAKEKRDHLCSAVISWTDDELERAGDNMISARKDREAEGRVKFTE
jgi:hypothetical protein